MTAQVALVEPAPPLAAERLARYGRQLALPGFDELAQRRLAAARVLVIGAGGLGSATVPYLAAAGVGTIGIVDTDVVELSNLHRQVAHGMHDLGRSKIDSLTDTVLAIDPEIVVVPHAVRLDSSNALGLFAQYDLVLDGSDNFPTRYLVSDAAELSGIPLVWGSILGYGGQVGVSWAQRGPTWRDLFPQPPAPGEVPSCATGGVLPGVCATIGSIMVTEAMKLVTGVGTPLLGRVSVYDAVAANFREISFERSPDAAAVTGLVDYELFCGLREAESTAVGAAEHSGTEVSPARLAELLRGPGELQLIDVREPWEASIVSLEGSELIPLGGLPDAIDRVRRDVPVVLYCHSGVRSAQAVRFLDNAGVRVSHLTGGIDAYATSVDPTLARY